MAAEPLDDVALARRGDVDAFGRLYKESAPAVYRVCRRMVADETQARELVQDTFVRAWERLTQFRGDSAFTTWLHRLAVTTTLEHLRRTRRDLFRHVEADDDLAVRSTASALDARVDVEAALDKLPPGARTVFVLHDIEGYSHDEIARMTGIAAGTARAQLWRARRALSKLLAP